MVFYRKNCALFEKKYNSKKGKRGAKKGTRGRVVWNFKKSVKKS